MGGRRREDHGVAPATNKSRQNAYDLAVGAKHAKVIRLLTPSSSDKDIKEGAVDGLSSAANKNNFTPLMFACRHDDLDQARQILDSTGGDHEAAKAMIEQKSTRG